MVVRFFLSVMLTGRLNLPRRASFRDPGYQHSSWECRRFPTEGPVGSQQ
ncbi:MAG: hypothetical protein P0Y53_13680 [Candidatus Pseudobacter hemicellulosilyticus]|uniref:Uncharacterized protein n=1 Tax=Candidatus Pseudobacter hemicellulosilyticus TaxID=3121375 RepID=A0AAJ5WMW4_9BACT|nr:MAG: hypothetical protein P0Y53_13680 [Pseudobacter sp.]